MSGETEKQKSALFRVYCWCWTPVRVPNLVVWMAGLLVLESCLNGLGQLLSRFGH
jgi:hypothetical protein